MVSGDALIDLFLSGLNLDQLQGLLQDGGLSLQSLCVPGLLNALLPQSVASPKQAHSQQA
jgi:hypothetical protein